VTAAVGVVLVTRDSTAWIDRVWKSIITQDHPLAHIVVIDDESTDGTRNRVVALSDACSAHKIEFDLMAPTTTAQDSTTRIAQNFCQGVLRLRHLDAVALADHDDLWHTDRVSLQVRALEESTIMLASNGDVPHTGSTLFHEFGVPRDFMEWDARSRVRWVTRRSVATGSASVVVPRLLCADPNFVPPPGWLHDRWWSILAASRDGLVTQQDTVIDYHLSESQQVGLDPGRQRHGMVGRLASLRPSDARRFLDLMRMRASADPTLRSEFTPAHLARALAS